MQEACSVCGAAFDVSFRYQMEERENGFAFYCSQKCHAANRDAPQATCGACAKAFHVELVIHVLHVQGARVYACSDDCRTQILAEAQGARLGLSPRPRATPRARRVAVFNHKGGTGKTTTSVTLAQGLAARGVRVLLVDTDSQGNVGASFGIQAERTLYHVLVMGLSAKDAAVTVRPNLDVLIANETLAAAELYLAGRPNRDRILRERLARTSDAYDITVLDCSPSLSLLNQNALVFADGILVPVACDFLSLIGVRQVLKTVKSVNTLLRHPVDVLGVLPTFYDARARICRDAHDKLKEHFGDRCLPPIKQATRMKEAPAHGKTILEHAPDSTAAADYSRVVDWMLQISAAEPPPQVQVA